MTANLFRRLQRLLPPPQVLIGRVLEHHDDDTSTVELPLGVGLAGYVDGLSAGSLMRPRGTTVPIGANAFIRAGVIESQAPDGDPLDIEIGQFVCRRAALVFVGPIPDQAAPVGVAWTFATAGYFSGGFTPLVFSLAAGTLPAGLTLDAGTGVISGTPTQAIAAGGLVVRVTDSTGGSAESNAFTVDSGAGCYVAPMSVAAYTLLSGNGALFTDVATPYGPGIAVAEQNTAAVARIEHAVNPARTIGSVTFRARLDSDRTDDGPFLALRLGGVWIFAFSPKREHYYDSSERPTAYWRDGVTGPTYITSLGATQQVLGRWYQYDVDCSGARVILTQTDLVTLAEVVVDIGPQSFPGQLVDQFDIYADSAGPTSAGTYAAVIACPKP